MGPYQARRHYATPQNRDQSFRKTLKREEIYAGDYRDLGDLNRGVEEFIERYYNPRRLHSALGYRSPGEFEQRESRSRL